MNVGLHLQNVVSLELLGFVIHEALPNPQSVCLRLIRIFNFSAYQIRLILTFEWHRLTQKNLPLPKVRAPVSLDKIDLQFVYISKDATGLNCGIS